MEAMAILMMGLTSSMAIALAFLCCLFCMGQVQKRQPSPEHNPLGLFRAGWVENGMIGRTTRQAQAEGYERVFHFVGEHRTLLVFISTQLTQAVA